MAGAHLFFKCENLQRVGAFKFRGATNAVAVARRRGGGPRRGHPLVGQPRCGAGAGRRASAAVPAFVVMPRTAPAVKRAAVAGYGARIVRGEPTLAARESTLAEVVRDTGAAVCTRTMTPRHRGAGTAGPSSCSRRCRGSTWSVAPVGAAGLLSGTAIAARGLRADVRVIGTEPAGADDACARWPPAASSPPSIRAPCATGC